MAFITWETPSGTIDGVNRTFTTAYNIYQVADLLVDGVDYTGTLSVSGNTISIVAPADPPTTSISVQYFTTNPSTGGAFAGTVTLATSRDDFQDYKKDITDVSNPLFIKWCNWLNTFLYRQIKSTDPERFIAEDTINVAANSGTYALPNDFRDMVEYGCGLYEHDANGVPQYPGIARTAFGSGLKGFYIKGGNLVLTPTPTAATTYTLRYMTNISQLTALTDTWIVPITDEYRYHLVQALDLMYTQWDEDVGMESFADQRFIRKLSELLDTIRKEPASYFMPDASVTF